SCIKRYITDYVILQARSWQNSIQQPLWRYFPAETCGRKHRILPFYIDAHAEDKLQIGTVNISAADEEGHVEIVPKQMTQSRIVQARLSLRSNNNRVGKLHIEANNRAEGLQCVRQRGPFRETE